MTVGDPKKAIVLAIIAVIIVCVAVFRSIPTPEPATGRPTALPAAAKQDERAKAEPPTEATVDSFSHPSLATKEPQKPKKQAPAADPADRTQGPWKVDPESILGSLPGATDNPGEKTGKGQQVAEKGVVRLRLEAIVRGVTSLALVSVADSPSAPYAEGSMINGHIKLVSISESSIVIEASGSSKTVRVGEEIAL